MSYQGNTEPLLSRVDGSPTVTAIGNADDCLYRAWAFFISKESGTEAERAVATDTIADAITEQSPRGEYQTMVSFVCKVAGCEGPCSYVFEKKPETGEVFVKDAIMPPLEVDCRFIDSE